MNKKQLKELRQQSKTQLKKQVEELEQKLAKSSLKLAAGKLDDLKEPSRIKTEIAQIKTIISEKKLLAAAKAKLKKEAA